jgi:hypothetical protein
VLSDNEPAAPSTGSERKGLSADTASSAARNRASQRIQEERRNLGSGESAYNSSVEDEVAQAKWSPLFSTKKATSPGRPVPGAGIAEAKPDRRPAARSATAAPAAVTAAAPSRGSHSLSDEEGSILAEILSTSDITRQNELIAHLKQLRVISSGDAPIKAESSRGAPASSAASDYGSGSEAGTFGQFQKLEENTLNEHDRRLKSSSSQHGEFSSPQRGAASGSNQPATPDSSTARAPPSDAAASAGPSSVSLAFLTEHRSVPPN